MGRSCFWKKACAGIAATAIAASLGAAGGGVAYADSSCATASTDVATQTIDHSFLTNYLTSYGVRAGSAGPDYLGITNTNFDFTNGSASSDDEYSAYYSEYAANNISCTTPTSSLCALNIWGNSAINETPNRFYANLLYNMLYGSEQITPHATTWMSNPNTSSWGDSNGSASTRYDSLLDGSGTTSTTIAGLEYDPDIIWGANKSGGWYNYGGYGSTTNPDTAGIKTTNMYTYTHNTNTTYTPANNAYVNYDATNIWTQVYSMNMLAAKADGLTAKSVRYNSDSATASANAYEKAIRGNLLYVAAELDAYTQSNHVYGTKKKTVAYLYAIDNNNIAYFFTPTAASLTSGNDTGKASTASYRSATDYPDNPNTTPNPDTNYAANNATIDLGYMDTLPFVTNTFANGDTISYTDEDGHNYSGICMRVEDIEKVNPAVSVTKANNTNLANVDVIIYNTNTALTSAGISGGKNRNGITNAATLTDSVVSSWLENSGFSGTLIAGDDFGTSKNQPTENIAVNDSGYTYPNGTSPRLYCQRNYTADKNARAAWAFSMVYPELYNTKYDSYAYWVDEVYHVKSAMVDDVVRCMCKIPSNVTVPSDTSAMEARFNIGYVWWAEYGQGNNTLSGYKYYTGSSRASFYDGLDESRITDGNNTYAQVGIYQPSSQWSLSSSSTAYTTAKTTVDLWYSDGDENQVNPIASKMMSLLSVPKAYAEGETRAETPYTQGDIAENNLHYAFYKVSGGRYDEIDSQNKHYELVLSPIDSTKEATVPSFEGTEKGPWFMRTNDYGDVLNNNNARFLQSVVIEEGITEIGASAFTSPTSMAGTSTAQAAGNTILFVELPKSLKKIGKSAFRDCGSVYKTNVEYTSYPVTITLKGCTEDGVDGSKLEQIAAEAFYGFDPYCSTNTRSVSSQNTINIVYLPETCSVNTDAFLFGKADEDKSGVWKDAYHESFTGITGTLTEKASEVIKFVGAAQGSSNEVVGLIAALDSASESFAEDVAAARAAYVALDESRKAEVSEDALTALEAAEAIVKTQTDLAAAQAELEQAKKDAETTSAELTSLKNDVADLNSQLTDAQKKLAETQTQLEEAQAAAAQQAITTVTINKATVAKADIAKYAKATTVVLGAKVKKIAKGAFAGSKVKTVVVQSKKLKKAKIKGCFKGAKKVKTIQVPAKKFKAYKKIFTKKITKSSKKLTVM